MAVESIICGENEWKSMSFFRLTVTTVRLCWLVINVARQSGLSKKQKNVSIPTRLLNFILKKHMFYPKGEKQLKQILAEFMNGDGNWKKETFQKPRL